MTKCPRCPPLDYRRERCHLCGALDEHEAATKCQSSYCGADFDADGYAVTPTLESLVAGEAWHKAHHDCEDDCLARFRKDRAEITALQGQLEDLLLASSTLSSKER